MEELLETRRKQLRTITASVAEVEMAINEICRKDEKTQEEMKLKRKLEADSKSK